MRRTKKGKIILMKMSCKVLDEKSSPMESRNIPFHSRRCSIHSTIILEKLFSVFLFCFAHFLASGKIKVISTTMKTNRFWIFHLVHFVIVKSEENMKKGKSFAISLRVELK